MMSRHLIEAIKMFMLMLKRLSVCDVSTLYRGVCRNIKEEFPKVKGGFRLINIHENFYEHTDSTADLWSVLVSWDPTISQGRRVIAWVWPPHGFLLIGYATWGCSLLFTVERK